MGIVGTCAYFMDSFSIMTGLRVEIVWGLSQRVNCLYIRYQSERDLQCDNNLYHHFQQYQDFRGVYRMTE